MKYSFFPANQQTLDQADKIFISKIENTRFQLRGKLN